MDPAPVLTIVANLQIEEKAAVSTGNHTAKRQGNTPNFELRCQAYGLDGDFEHSLREVWAVAGPKIGEIVSELLQQQAKLSGDTVSPDKVSARLAYAEGKLARPVDQSWIDRIAARGQSIAADGTSFYTVAAGMLAAQRRIHDLIFSEVSDLEQLRRMTWATQMLAVVETEIIVSDMSRISDERARDALRAQCDMFRDAVAGSIDHVSEASRDVRQRAEQVARSTINMLAKSAEVAAAAVQSANAMQEAARTAGGLIQAIEEARAEVEGSASVANRAFEEAGQAVAVTAGLSKSADAIESIVTLIRSIAGQTNLLALNATIEAARAGDSGRGFAVVAQEVKALASQTAKATDDIAAQIASVQHAARETAAANESVRDTVTNIRGRAERIRTTMDRQADTVTMITAAIDETATSASSTSLLISSIQQSTEGIAKETDAAREAFGGIDNQLRDLSSAVATFLGKVA